MEKFPPLFSYDHLVPTLNEEPNFLAMLRVQVFSSVLEAIGRRDQDAIVHVSIWMLKYMDIFILLDEIEDEIEDRFPGRLTVSFRSKEGTAEKVSYGEMKRETVEWVKTISVRVFDSLLVDERGGATVQ